MTGQRDGLAGSAGRVRRVRAHPVFAAVYDPLTRPLERAVLAGPRARLLSGLTGRALDVGAGTGTNLQYLRRASRVVAAEPDPAMRKRLLRPVPPLGAGQAAAGNGGQAAQ